MRKSEKEAEFFARRDIIACWLHEKIAKKKGAEKLIFYLRAVTNSALFFSPSLCTPLDFFSGLFLIFYCYFFPLGSA